MFFDDMDLVDLSMPIKTPSPEEVDPAKAEGLAGVVTYLDHKATVPKLCEYFGCTEEDLGGIGWATERVALSTHAGTHVDAPYHYYPVCDGKPSITIDECPLEWYIGRGVVLDFTYKKPGETVSAQEVKDQLEKLNYKLSYGDMVFIRFDGDKRIGRKEYWISYPGMSAEATKYILDQGVKVTGVDTPGWDIPFNMTKDKFAETHDRGILWEAHRAGKDYSYSHIEKLGNLDKVPQTGFYAMCFPVSIYKASAAWARVVAFVPRKK